MALFIDGKQALGSLVIEGDLTQPMPTYKTASGSVATFKTDMTENLISCVAEIVASGGGGTPSTPIAITGVSSVTVTANSTPYVCNLGDTYYGGSVDVVTGKIIKTYGLLNLSDFTWILASSNDSSNRFSTAGVIPLASQNTHNNICSFDVGGWIQGNSITSSDTTVNALDIRTTSILVNLRKTIFNGTAEQFNTWVSDKQICYEIATPITAYASNSLEIPTINGTNNLFADTGDISAKYILSVGEALRQA